MKIAVIGGTGGQGLGVATRFVKAGEDVIIGSRTSSARGRSTRPKPRSRK